MKKRISILANIIIPLMVGAAFYLAASPDVIFVKTVGLFWGMPEYIGHVGAEGGCLQLMRYYMLDALWAYALVFALYFVIGNNAARVRVAFLIAICFSTFMEVIQLIPTIPGIFDYLDILVEALAEAVAAFIIKIHYEEAWNICETK